MRPRGACISPRTAGGRILFRLTGFPDSQPATDALCVGVGLLTGSVAGDRVPVIDGLPPCSEDQLKALGAAAASSGAVALFHAVGITPEAPTLADAFQGARPDETIEIRPGDIADALRRLSTVPDGTPLTAVCLGTPHFSRAEWDRLLPLLRRHAPDRGMPIYVNTGRATLGALEAEGVLDQARDVNLIRRHRHLHVPDADPRTARRRGHDELRQVGALCAGQYRRPRGVR